MGGTFPELWNIAGCKKALVTCKQHIRVLTVRFNLATSRAATWHILTRGASGYDGWMSIL